MPRARWGWDGMGWDGRDGVGYAALGGHDNPIRKGSSMFPRFVPHSSVSREIDSVTEQVQCCVVLVCTYNFIHARVYVATTKYNYYTCDDLERTTEYI